MELAQLEAFLAVVREGSFSGAAKVLYRTQPAVTQIVQRLEREIGQPLFDRSSRRGVLTDAGRVLVEHAERLLHLRRQTLAALSDVRSHRTGLLEIAANELTCLYLLPALAEYRRLYPGIRVTVQRTLASRIPALVREHIADLGIVTYSPGDAALASTVIYRDELALVVPPSHPLAKARTVAITQLGAESFVAHHVASPYRQRVLEAFRRSGVPLQMPLELPTIDAIRKFVVAGNGVALLPAVAVEPELARGELVRVKVPELTLQRRIRLIARQGATLSHAAEAFQSVVEAYARRHKGRHLFEPDLPTPRQPRGRGRGVSVKTPSPSRA
ncbi:MAG: LysR substrate-binding domain-containing protein [Vicinamibacterales bacterium]